jgi:hypothetical protein
MNSIEVHSSYTTGSCLTSNGRCAGVAVFVGSLWRDLTLEGEVNSRAWLIHGICIWGSVVWYTQALNTQHKCSAQLMYFLLRTKLAATAAQSLRRVEDEVWHLWVRKLFAYHAHGPLPFWTGQFWLACGLGKIWKVHPSVGGAVL